MLMITGVLLPALVLLSGGASARQSFACSLLGSAGCAGAGASCGATQPCQNPQTSCVGSSCVASKDVGEACTAGDKMFSSEVIPNVMEIGCVGGTVQYLNYLGRGSSCASSSACFGSLFCDAGGCCAAPANLTQCSNELECLSGETCDQGTNACVPRIADGLACPTSWCDIRRHAFSPFEFFSVSLFFVPLLPS
jgi:hypothetical protein